MNGEAHADSRINRMRLKNATMLPSKDVDLMSHIAESDYRAITLRSVVNEILVICRLQLEKSAHTNCLICLFGVNRATIMLQFCPK